MRLHFTILPRLWLLVPTIGISMSDRELSIAFLKWRAYLTWPRRKFKRTNTALDV